MIFLLLIKENNAIFTPRSLLQNLIETPLYKNYTESLLKIAQKLKMESKMTHSMKSSKKRLLSRLNILCNISENYSNIQSFLNAMVLGGSDINEEDGVNLLSVHASKGLEFSCVL